MPTAEGTIIIHVDMDAFFASVEMRDDPSLRGKPLIIGSLPRERGVVATCSYEARKYGVRSAMNIKEAYRLCPDGYYMHPNFDKYKEASRQIHEIWDSYSDLSESIALDEAYLDVTAAAGTFEKAVEIGHAIKRRIAEEVGLGCSVGVAYSKSAAKTASEEKKPDGFYVIRTPEEFVELVSDRDVRTLYTVGRKTAEKLHGAGIDTVRGIRENPGKTVELLGNAHGEMLVGLAKGIDTSKVTPRRPEEAKSVGREITFQKDVSDHGFLKDVLLLLALCVEERAGHYGLHGTGVSLKVTYSNMESVTRSRSVASSGSAAVIYSESSSMLDTLGDRPVRLIGTGIYNTGNGGTRQLTLDDVFEIATGRRTMLMRNAIKSLEDRYGLDFTGMIPEMIRSDRLHDTVEKMRAIRERRIVSENTERQRARP